MKSVTDEYTEREQALATVCVQYAHDHSHAGLPGHALMLLVARMYHQLQEMQKKLDKEGQA